jgi:ATP-dependent Clp protease ATP-binding subunit ClpA
MLAQEEARRLGHNFVGTEQILLGLIGESTGIAAKVLKSMGVNLKDARVEVEKIIGTFVALQAKISFEKVPYAYVSSALLSFLLQAVESSACTSPACTYQRYMRLLSMTLLQSPGLLFPCRERKRFRGCGDPIHTEGKAGA